MVCDGVTENAIKPRHSFLAAVQLRAMLQRLEQTLLQQIFRLCFTPGARGQETLKACALGHDGVD